jgi:hypothetical protein
MIGAMLTLALAAGDGGTRTIAVPLFHAVELATRATVLVERAAGPGVSVDGDPRSVRCITATVRGGTLIIGWSGRGRAGGSGQATADAIVVNARNACRHPSNARQVTVRVGAPAIDGVMISEQGSISVGPMRVPAFAAAIPGRGDILVTGLEADRTSLAIAGIGHAIIGGTPGRLAITIPGRGVVDTRSARARSLDIAIAGHGDVEATVDGPATGALAGSGAIAIGGHPACAIRKLGHGSIQCPAG